MRRMGDMLVFDNDASSTALLARLIATPPLGLPP